MSGIVNPLLKGSPTVLIDFGTVDSDELPTSNELILEPSPVAAEGRVFAHARVQTSDPFLNGSVEELDLGRVRITATLSEATPLGQYSSRFRIVLASHEVSIPVFAQVSGEQRLEPPSLVFGSLAPGRTVEKSCELIGIYDRSQVMLRPLSEIADGSISARLEQTDGRTLIHVAARGLDRAGISSTSLLLSMADKGRSIQLPILAVSSGKAADSH